MTIGFIGLGRMGSLMVSRLLTKNIRVIAFDIDNGAARAVVKRGAKGAESIKEIAQQLQRPRMVWIMVPHGKPLDAVILELAPHLSRGDSIIDGGNSYYKDSIRRADRLKRRGIHFLDVGVSGGLEGAKKGSSLMVGGEKKTYKAAEPIFKALAQKNGYSYMGKSGAGHFVKMVHNGIEYALLQSYGEGYKMLERSPFRPDLREVTKVWRNGSVIRSWLLDLAQDAFDKDPKLQKVSGIVCGGSTGKWTVKTAKELKTNVPVIAVSLKLRYQSRKNPDFSSKVVAVLRRGFGGHTIPKKGEECAE